MNNQEKHKTTKQNKQYQIDKKKYCKQPKTTKNKKNNQKLPKPISNNQEQSRTSKN